MASQSAFVDAAACGDLEDVKRMLNDESTTAAIINGVDKDGRSALHYACLNDDVNLLPILLNDERVDVSLTTPKGEGIFHMAALYSSLQALKLLFSNPRTKTLVNFKNKYGETPLHLAAGSGDKNAIKTIQLLLQNNANLFEVDQWNRGPLDCARLNGNHHTVDMLEEYLKTQSPEVVQKVREITKKENESREQLPSVNKANRVNLAATFNQVNLGGMKGSLKKVETKEKYMFKAFDGKVTDKAGSVDAKSSGKVLSKLIDFPGDKDEIIKLIKDPSVDVCGKDAYGLTALHKFASWNKTELIDLILPQLSPEQLNDQDIDGKTALHWACEMASVSTVRYLVKLGVRKDIRDIKGRTVFDVLNSGEGAVIDRIRKALEG